MNSFGYTIQDGYFFMEQIPKYCFAYESALMAGMHHNSSSDEMLGGPTYLSTGTSVTTG